MYQQFSYIWLTAKQPARIPTHVHRSEHLYCSKFQHFAQQLHSGLIHNHHYQYAELPGICPSSSSSDPHFNPKTRIQSQKHYQLFILITKQHFYEILNTFHSQSTPLHNTMVYKWRVFQHAGILQYQQLNVFWSQFRNLRSSTPMSEHFSKSTFLHTPVSYTNTRLYFLQTDLYLSVPYPG